MERRFPFTPRVQPGEAPLSVLRRGALGNGHKSTMRYAYSVNSSLDYAANTLGSLARNRRTYFETCEGIGLPRNEIEAIAYDRIGRGREDHVVWMGLAVRQDCLRFRRSKICVACYIELGYAPASWDHVASLACSKHRILLDDACPCCGVPWTPDRDPFGCGCDRETMVALQQPCSDRAARLLDHIIDVQDQDGLAMLGHFWHLSEYWREIGLRLSKADVAEALAELIACDWPLLPPQVEGHALHPRVVLAPLLATRDRRCRIFANNLLTKHMPTNHATRLDDVFWPATTVQAVLGIGRVPFTKLINDQHIVPTADGRYCAAAVNDLLSYIAAGSKSEEVELPIPNLRSGNRQKSLAQLIGMIKSQDVAAYSCPPQGGLADMRCVPQYSPAPKALDGISRHDAAIRLGTSVESVRLAIKLKLLQATKGSPWSAVQWVINQRSLEEFEAKFVFASAIARHHGAALTTVSSRLRSAGLHPISGPGIDGGGSFLFMRDDVERINLHVVLTQPYQSPAGRKRRVDSELSMPVGLLSSTEVAEKLGVSVRQLRDIVQQGWIEPVAIISQRRAFSPKTVHALQCRLRKDFLPLVDAAQLLGQTKAQFHKTWISTGAMRCHYLSRKVLIQRVDLERAELIWRDFGSSSSIAAALNRDFWLCHALEKMGQMTAVKTLGSGPKSVRLYKRDTPMLEDYRIRTPER